MTQKKILITLDGSTMSRQILPKVRSLFTPQEAELIFLRIAMPPTDPPAMAYAQESQAMPDIQYVQWDSQIAAQEWQAYRSAIEGELKQEAADFQRAGYTVQTVVDIGAPVDAIAEYIEIHAIDLLAMATHGRRGISKMLLGSVAEELLRKVSIPILLVRPSQEQT